MEGGGGEIKIPLESAVKGVGNVSLSGATCSIRVVPSAGVGNTGIAGDYKQNSKKIPWELTLEMFATSQEIT